MPTKERVAMAGTARSDDARKIKERTKHYYDGAADATRVKTFWNLGYSSVDTLREIQERIPEFGRHNETDGFSEQLYFAVLRDIPIKLEELAEMSVLDVGCGLGEGLNFLSRMLPETSMIGLDLSPRAVRSANLRVSRGPALSFVRGDAEDMPFDDAGLDVIINVEGAQSYPDARGLLREVARTLKPGGYFSQADLYVDDERWERTLSARTDVGQLEWICNKDISSEVRAALKSRLAPGSHFQRKFGDAPKIVRASAIRHFDLLCGQGAPATPGASYRLSVAQKT
jgi:SAM-dependent methyltransferase